MKREVARLVGFTAGYALVVLLERLVRRIAEDERRAAAELAAADELARRRSRCNCSRCEAPARSFEPYSEPGPWAQDGVPLP